MILKGEKAPNFKLQDTQGEEVELHALLEHKEKLLLLFFPLAFTGTCTEELCSTRDNMKFYNAFNAEVVAISVDSFFALNAFKKSQNLNFRLLSDFNKTASRDFGVLYEDFHGMKGVSKRAAFVIDSEKMIRYSEVLEDAGKLPDFDAIRRAIQEQ